MVNSPVIFLVFNRPDTTRRVFERIRAARPPKLLVVADGPRQGRPEDPSAVEEVRKIIRDGVDWPCDVLTNYSDVNLGCRERVSSGLNWAFDQVEEAIVLEDDCLPVMSFFRYCDLLLARFRTENRVLHINGFNPVQLHFRSFRKSYYFSAHAQVWGWASWRRAWRYYSTMEREIPLMIKNCLWRSRVFSEVERNRLRRNWTAITCGEVNSWAFQWSLAIHAANGLAVSPFQCLVKNIGIGHPQAVHARERRLHYQEPLVRELDFPVRHPREMEQHTYADKLLERINCPKPPLVSRVSRRILKYLKSQPSHKAV